jgi:hypothetical protein
VTVGCHARLWLQLGGYALIVIPLFIRGLQIHLYVNYKSNDSTKFIIDIFSIFLGCLMFVTEIVLLAYWSNMVMMEARSFNLRATENQLYMYACFPTQSSSKASQDLMFNLLLAYNIILLFPMIIVYILNFKLGSEFINPGLVIAILLDSYKLIITLPLYWVTEASADLDTSLVQTLSLMAIFSLYTIIISQIIPVFQEAGMLDKFKKFLLKRRNGIKNMKMKMKMKSPAVSVDQLDSFSQKNWASSPEPAFEIVTFLFSMIKITFTHLTQKLLF